MRHSVMIAMLSAGVVATGGAQAPRPAGSLDITVHEGTSMAIALSPDKRTLVIDLQGGLWTLPAAGGATRRIIDEYGDARQPAWSPDGRRIAFQSYRDGMWRIWSVAPDGSDAKALTSGPFDDREPHWSPDGRSIAFSSDRSGNYDVWVLDVASGATRQITHDPGNDFLPTWSPDGRELAFVSTRTPTPGVYATTIDGRERLVSVSTGAVGAPSWSPDGAHVLYSVLPAGGFNAVGETRLMLDARQIATNEDYFPFRAQWLSNDDFLYPADGRIKRRSLATGRVDAIDFSATLRVTPASYMRKKRDFDSTAPQPVKGIIHPVASHAHRVRGARRHLDDADWRNAAAADRRCVRRYRSGVVARRIEDRLFIGPLGRDGRVGARSHDRRRPTDLEPPERGHVGDVVA